MAHLKDVITRINLIASTQQITKAMKMIAAAKLHKVQQSLLPLKSYTTQHAKLLDIAQQGIHPATLSHPLMNTSTSRLQRLLLIVVTSDRGLCGAFNKNIIKAASQQIEKLQQTQAVLIEVLVIGKKAYQFFSKNHENIEVIDHYADILSKDVLKHSTALATYCIDAFQRGYYTKILLVYTAFINAMKREITISPFLPFSHKQADQSSQAITKPLHYIYEPSAQMIIQKLIPEILKYTLMQMLIESSASEHAARMTTMSQATDNADKFLKELRISYNRTRQALITNSLAEITSGAEALATV